VDEAANHIRELVDPDANIIWGSAFNPELEGKIRVSVVATGIEATTDVAAPVPQPEAPRVFSFNAPRREPAATVAPLQPPVEAPAQPAASFTSPAEPAADRFEDELPEASATASDEDELVLGRDALMDVPPSDAAPTAEEPAAGEPSIRRRWLTGAAEDEAPAEPAPKLKTGGTLFERMSGRGARAEENGEDKAPLDIPRFLHRQNNQ
jgi:cell division protein FtsZ